jgi:hypothetical protein
LTHGAWRSIVKRIACEPTRESCMRHCSIQRTAACAATGAAVAVVVVVSALFSAGCAARYRVDTQKSADGTTTYTVANNEITTEGGTKYDAFAEQDRHIEKRCFLDLRACDKPGAKRTFSVVLTYIGSAELNIKPGRSLEIVIGLNSTTLSAGGGEVTKTKDPSTKLVTESVAYPVSSELLIAMSEAEEIQVIVNGEDGRVKGSFNDENFANLRRFVDEYVE